MNRDAFDDLMTGLDSAMIVVTACDGRERAGCLVGFHSQCSIEPARYAVWLSKANHTYLVALRSTHLVVHFLAEHDRELAERFGGETGDEVDKFAGVEWTPGPDGVPMLTACPNRIVVRRTVLLDETSDHACVMTEPIEISVTPGFVPLRYASVRDIDAGHDAH